MATQQVNGKVAIVTGGSSGIGHGIVTRLVKEGGKVAIADINEDAGKKIAEEFNANKSEKVAIFHKTDVSKWDDLISLFDKTKETFGRIDIVINNAGTMDLKYGMFEDSLKEPDHYNKVIDINLMGAIYGTKLAFQYMKQNNPQGGTIINTASTSAVYPTFAYAVYGATKAGVVSLTRSMAQVGGLFNITVNAVCPNATKSGMTVDAIGRIPEHWWSPIDDVIETFFRCIYDSKINGSTFSIWHDGIKEEKFEKNTKVLDEMHEGNYNAYLKTLEK